MGGSTGGVDEIGDSVAGESASAADDAQFGAGIKSDPWNGRPW